MTDLAFSSMVKWSKMLRKAKGRDEIPRDQFTVMPAFYLFLLTILLNFWIKAFQKNVCRYLKERVKAISWIKNHRP